METLLGTKRGAIGLAVGCGLLIGVVLVGMAQAQTTPSSTAASGQTQDERLISAALGRFAARLGTDDAGLNAAFASAVGETLDSAVADGSLPPTKATEIKGIVARDGLKGLLLQGSHSQNSSRPSDSEQALARAVWDAAAGSLGIAPDQMKQTLGQTRQSIGDLASARHVDGQQLRTAMLAAGRSALDSQVQAGVLTRAEADEKGAKIVDSLVDNMLRSQPDPAASVGPRKP